MNVVAPPVLVMSPVCTNCAPVAIWKFALPAVVSNVPALFHVDPAPNVTAAPLVCQVVPDDTLIVPLLVPVPFV